MFKIKNISNCNRKFRIKKTAEGFLIRPGEELTIAYEPIIDRPDIFKVTNLDIQEKEENKILDSMPKKKRTKIGEKE